MGVPVWSWDTTNMPQTSGTPLAPLTTITLPDGLLSHAIGIAYGVIVLFVLIYTVAAAYHWLRYGHRSWITIPAILIHLAISGSLLLYMATSLA